MKRVFPILILIILFQPFGPGLIAQNRRIVKQIQANAHGFTQGNFGSASFLKPIDLSGAKFDSVVDFHSATFSSRASFRKATFNSHADFPTEADFSNTNFRDTAIFSEARFGVAEFIKADFNRGANFSGAKFEDINFAGAKFAATAGFKYDSFGSADFLGAKFDTAEFWGATFADINYFDKTTFAGKADFAHAKFDSAASFHNAVFNGEAIFYLTMFYNSADFALAKFANTADFVEAKFADETSFNSATFDGTTDFRNSIFSGNFSFRSASFNGTVKFGRNILPDTMDFSYATVANGNIIELSNALFADTTNKSNKKDSVHYINLYKTDISKFRLDYYHFRLLFYDPITKKELLSDEKKVLYEGLLKNFRDRGQEDSYQLLDIEYHDYLFGQHKYIRWWNLYGYRKAWIFIWIGLFLVLFTTITMAFIHNLQPKEDGIYYIERIPEDLEINSVKYFFRRLWYSFFYTAIIFFLFKLDLKNMNLKRGGILYIIIVYTVGLLCLGYLANFVIQK